MTQPAWLAGVLAAVMIATAVYCMSRLVAPAARRLAAERDADLVHAVMGVSMGGMLVTRLNPLPNAVWAVLFGLATVWFGGQIWRRAGVHHVPHLVMSGAMVYMLLAATGLTKHGTMGMGGARFPLVALVLAETSLDQALAEAKVTIEGDAQVFGGRFFAAPPLLFQTGTRVGEARRELIDEVGHQDIGLLDAILGVIDKGGLHGRPPAAHFRKVVVGE